MNLPKKNRDAFSAACEELATQAASQGAAGEALRQDWQKLGALRDDGDPMFRSEAEKRVPRLVEASLVKIGGKMALRKENSAVSENLAAALEKFATPQPPASSPAAGSLPAPAAKTAAALPRPVLVEPLAEAAAGPSESSPPPAAPPSGGSDSDASSTVRVAVSLLDKLMALMGEMVLVRNQVRQYSSRSDDLEFMNLSQRLDVVTSELQGEVMKTRMQPIGNVLAKFQRVVRDLGRDLGKRIDLHLQGADTEVDKTLLEAIKDPLTHIIRNSCDHGIETPAARGQARGGPHSNTFLS